MGLAVESHQSFSHSGPGLRRGRKDFKPGLAEMPARTTQAQHGDQDVVADGIGNIRRRDRRPAQPSELSRQRSPGCVAFAEDGASRVLLTCFPVLFPLAPLLSKGHREPSRTSAVNIIVLGFVWPCVDAGGLPRGDGRTCGSARPCDGHDAAALSRLLPSASGPARHGAAIC